MKIVFHLIIILELISINLYMSYMCCKRKKTAFVIGTYFLIFTIILMSIMLPILMRMPNYGNGNGLFMLFGFLYLIPLKYLYDHPMKYLIIIMCSTWIYTIFAFSLSVRVAYLFPEKWFTLSMVLFQTTFYAVTLSVFLKFVKEKFVFIIQNMENRTTNYLLILSLSWLFCGVLLNYNFVVGGSPVLKLIINFLLAANAVLSYKLFYSLVFVNISMKTLNEMTKTDTLTKLGNRDSLYGDALKRIENNIPFTIIFIDLDDFKMVNDCFGHPAGDAYLIEFANTIKEDFSENGCFYRMSGDEFVFLNEGQEVESVCARMGKLEFSNCQCGVAFKGLSLGYASFPADGSNISELLYLADLNMYQKKKIKRKNTMLVM